MAAALDNSNKNRYLLKFKQKVRTFNDRNIFLIPEGTPNNENNENNENSQYHKYRTYKEALKGSMIELNNRLRVFRDEEIVMAPDGIYTWIIKNNNFYAIRVFTQQEIGTLHLDLDRHTREGDITSAGELKIISDGSPKIAFNLQSGTYTAKINGFHLTADIVYLFDDEDKHDPEKSALVIDVQKDVKEIAEKVGYVPKARDRKFTADEIITLLRKRTPEEIKPIQKRTKNRFMIYKRNRMIKDVRSKICSFFKGASCDDVVEFLYSGNESDFINRDVEGHEFEVTAGKSLLVHPESHYNPIITTQANFNILHGLFKEGTIRKFMTRKHYPTKPKLNNNTNTKKRRISVKSGK
jgi:hypothetical protein